MRRFYRGVAALSLSLAVSSSFAEAQTTKPHAVTLTFGANLVTRDIYENALFPDFQKYWKQRTGETVNFEASFESSGAVARDVASGMPIDVVALSTADDMQTIQKAGYITHDWQQAPFHGIVSESIVAIAVRKGNPKHIENWSDLEKPGITVDLGDPITSGGCKWFTNAIFGSAIKGSNLQSAKPLLAGVYKNVKVLGKSAEDSMSTFKSGVGDAVINYQNEILDASNGLKTLSEVIPNKTILVQNPTAVVDKNVDRDDTRAVATAFITFLQSTQAQEVYAQYGFRPIRSNLARQFDKKYKIPSGLFTVSSLGGWAHLDSVLYGPKGIWTQVVDGQ